MDKEVERAFLETFPKALVSLPFDLKVLLEAVADPDLEHDVRELAAATVVHIITPKDGNVDASAPLRRGRDLAAPGAGEDRGRRRRGRARVPRALRRGLRRGSTRSWSCSGRRWATRSIEWLDSRWGVAAQGGLRQEEDPDVRRRRGGRHLPLRRGAAFGTEYPITEKSLAGRVKQAQPFVDHLARKREQDKRKITSVAGSARLREVVSPMSRRSAAAPFGAGPTGLLDLAAGRSRAGVRCRRPRSPRRPARRRPLLRRAAAGAAARARSRR